MSTAVHRRKARSNQIQQKQHGDVGAQRAACIESSAGGVPIDDDEDDLMEYKEESGAAGKEWINEVSLGIRHYLDQMYQHRTNTVFNRQDIETSKQWRSVIASIIEEHKKPKRYDIGTRPLIYDAVPPDHTTLQGFKVVEGKDGRRRLALTSLFEGGNLGFATAETSDEYRLCLDFDVNSNGYTQWFYFACKGRQGDIRKGRKVIFKIENISKPASLFDDDMVPVVWSVKENSGWHHGCENISTYRNEHSRRKGESYHTLKFSYTFQHDNDVVFFAFHYPYTYSYLQDFLARLEADSYRREWIKRRSLCSTISGLRTDILTIANFKASDVYMEMDATGERLRRKRPVCVVTARVHPGESNSSFMMHGFLTFLTGSSPQAKVLREKMIWMVIPMLNPDGVVQGNTRCNLAGVDLNRMYLNPSRYLQPTIFFLKNMMRQTLLEGRQIKFFLDLHGHSKRKGIFAYGNHYVHEPELNPMIRLFPKLCALASDDFVYKNCSFDMLPKKDGTGRVITFREMDVLNSYTIEASFWSYDRAKLSEDNDDKNMVGAFYNDMDNRADAGSGARGNNAVQRRQSVGAQLGDKAKAQLLAANMEFDRQQQRLLEQEEDRRLRSRRASYCPAEDGTTVGGLMEENMGDPRNAVDVLKRRLEDIAQQVGKSGQECDKWCLPNKIASRIASMRTSSSPARRSSTAALSVPVTTKKKESASSLATLHSDNASRNKAIGTAAASEGESPGVFSWRRLCTNGAVLGRAIVAYLDLTETAMALHSTSTEVLRLSPQAVTVPRHKTCVCCMADALEDEVYELNGGEAQLPYLTYARLESKAVEQLVHRIMVGRTQNRALIADTNSGSESDPEADKLDDKELDKIHRRIFSKIRSLERRRRGMLAAHKDEKLIVAFGRSERACIKGEFYRRVMAWASMPKIVDRLKNKLERERERTIKDGPRARRQAQKGVLKSGVLYDFVNATHDDNEESDEDGSDEYSGENDDDTEVTAEEAQQLARLVEQCQQERIVLSLYRKAEEALVLPFTIPWVHRLLGRNENTDNAIAVPIKSNPNGVAKAFSKCGRAQDTPGRCALAAFKPHKSLRGQVMNATRTERAKLKMENEIYRSTLTRESGIGQSEVLQILPARPESANSIMRPQGTTGMQIPKRDGRDDGCGEAEIASPSPVSGRRGSFGSRRGSFSTEELESKVVTRKKVNEGDRRSHLYERAHGANKYIVGGAGPARRKSDGGSPYVYMYIQVGALTEEGPVFVDDSSEGPLSIWNVTHAIPYYTQKTLISNIAGYMWTTPGYQIPQNSPRRCTGDNADGSGGVDLPPGVSIVIADDAMYIPTIDSEKSASRRPSVKIEARGVTSPSRRASASSPRRSFHKSDVDGGEVEYVAARASPWQEPVPSRRGAFRHVNRASTISCGPGGMASILEEDADPIIAHAEGKPMQQDHAVRRVCIEHAPDAAAELQGNYIPWNCAPTSELPVSPSFRRSSTTGSVDEKSSPLTNGSPRSRTGTPKFSNGSPHGRRRFSRSEKKESDYCFDEEMDHDEDDAISLRVLCDSGKSPKSHWAQSAGAREIPHAWAASPRHQSLTANSSGFDDDSGRSSSMERRLSGVRVPFAVHDSGFDDDSGRPSTTERHLSRVRQYSSDSFFSGFDDGSRRPSTTEGRPSRGEQPHRMSLRSYTSPELGSGTSHEVSSPTSPVSVTERVRPPSASRNSRIIRGTVVRKAGGVMDHNNDKNEAEQGKRGCGDGGEEMLGAIGRNFSLRTPRANKGAVDVVEGNCEEDKESGADRRDSFSYYLTWRKDGT
eukprot:GEMP01000507.1.p1 GENE.GEMP01000507.1~~GEMP01000507.1.p1  ORF type:complete len:1794 (+),score=450.48 GEMP01000507.1:169-5550(+)